MSQKTLKSFFRPSNDSNEGEQKRRRYAEISHSTSWVDVEAAQRPGIQQCGIKEMTSDRTTSVRESITCNVRSVSDSTMVLERSSVTGTYSSANTEEIDPNETIRLSEKQYEVVSGIMQGKSIFFTGAAGTGKSHVVRIIRRLMAHLNLSREIAFTAPTGVAACNIRGLTLHSWAGIGLGNESTETLIGKVRGNRDARKRWESTSILVIDEISMLSGDLFDKLSKIGSQIRVDDRPFGGLQLVLSGDFFQLPPVGMGSKSKLCFSSETWRKIFDSSSESAGKVYILDKVFRQKDAEFLSILHEIRRGDISQSTCKRLSKKVAEDYHRDRKRKHNEESCEIPTKLFGKNSDVDRVNEEEIEKLDSLSITYVAVDEGEKEKYLVQLRNGTTYPAALTLKIGAQVMLLKNLDTAKGLVNGTRGKVVGFQKSHGRSSIFPDDVPEIEFSVSLGDGSSSVVKRVMTEESSDIEAGGKVVASRLQLPLMLAYAITIHKSQGMTIPHLEVSFRGIFEYGQAYVALSRATNLTGLVLKTFDPRVIKAHPDVSHFYMRCGYTCESEHEDLSTISTTLAELAKIYVESKGCQRDDIYARAPPQTSAWIVSKQKKLRSEISSASMIVQSDTSLKSPIIKLKGDLSCSDSININRFAKAHYDPINVEDPFMENSFIPLKKSNNISVKSSDAISVRDVNLTTTSRISEEQRRMIEANRLAALERMQSNRVMQDREKMRIFEEFSI